MHNKRILAVFIILLFCATLALGGSAVFSVVEVKASFDLVSFEQRKNAVSIQKTLDEFVGKNIMFVKKNELISSVDSYTYIKIDSIKKDYPSTLIINFSERQELFSLQVNSNYYMLDNDGYILSQKQTNTNNIDGYPNILLVLGEISVDIGNYLPQETKSDFLIIEKCISAVNTYFDKENIRNIISAVYIENQDLRLVMSEGLSIVIQNRFELLNEKINKALKFYTDSEEMTQEMKADKNSRIIAYKYLDGVRAVHTINYTN